MAALVEAQVSENTPDFIIIDILLAILHKKPIRLQDPRQCVYVCVADVFNKCIFTQVLEAKVQFGGTYILLLHASFNGIYCTF